jgi:hypothetical protein
MADDALPSMAFCHPGSSPVHPSKKGFRRVGTTVSCVAAFEGSPFVLGQSAPDAGVLAGLDSPFQAGFNDLAATADCFSLFYLEKRGAVVPDREEQLGVLAEAGSTVTPSHQDRAPCIEVRGQHRVSHWLVDANIKVNVKINVEVNT